MRRVLIGIAAAAAVGIGISAQKRPATPPPSPDEAAVRIVTSDAGRSEPGKKSDTDYWLESQIVRLSLHLPRPRITILVGTLNETVQECVFRKKEGKKALKTGPFRVLVRKRGFEPPPPCED